MAIVSGPITTLDTLALDSLIRQLTLDRFSFLHLTLHIAYDFPRSAQETVEILSNAIDHAPWQPGCNLSTMC